LVDQQARRHAERDDVRQRVERLAEGVEPAQAPGERAVEQVERPGGEDGAGRDGEVAFGGQHDRRDSTEEIGERDQIRHLRARVTGSRVTPQTPSPTWWSVGAWERGSVSA